MMARGRKALTAAETSPQGLPVSLAQPLAREFPKLDAARGTIALPPWGH